MKTEKRTYENGPYDKFLSHGSASLSKAELLAIILRTGTQDLTAVELGEQILQLAGGADGGLNSLHHLTLEQLMSVKGIGAIKAIKIRCLAEFAVRMAQESAAERLSFNCPESVADYYKETLRHSDRETVILLLLDNRLHLISEHILSVGTVKASLLSPREVFVRAARDGAVYVMLLHNHPSGDCTPSTLDRQVTEQIAESGRLLDIPLVDHIVIGDNIYYSFKENGLLF
ncbi:MAG: DNA repair protein RadC [Lachnospiraceae bacterium]|jgi:DNA repair protein RadC|nr:DNA repair protein RadC [Lachnospiraceae bacterium]